MIERDPHAVFIPCHPGIAGDPFSLFAEKGWGLRCKCWGCDHMVEILPSQLVARFGPDCTPGRLQPRLRCAECDGRQVLVYTVQSSESPRVRRPPRGLERFDPHATEQ